ncbi:hypothetical protein AAFN88_16850 [Pelagibius sp. CAU 1746]|uniref:hypothetical protein n=1 Tax=Pelagibius sp. CAU 1746 TaxID=3140370 RepID=UPI00325A454F
MDEAHYAGALPEEVEAFWEELNRTKLSWCDFRLAVSYQKTKAVLSYFAELREKNEICAIQCGDRQSSSSKAFDSPVQWLGIDVYVHGYGSVIRGGVFQRPDLFSEFVPELNRYGLFNLTEKPIPLLMERCRAISPGENVELFPQERELWQQVLVGRSL